MNVIARLASSLGRRDEFPNQELAALISRKKDSAAVDELMHVLTDGTEAQRGDAIKVLFEIGYVRPELIAAHTKQFIALLSTKENRLQWGTMTAIDTVTELKANMVYAALPIILDAARQGTVITRDHAVDILRKLGHRKSYANKISPLILDEVRRAPINQFPTYAERAAEVVIDPEKALLMRTINIRLPEVCSANAIKRLNKVMKKLEAGG